MNPGARQRPDTRINAFYTLREEIANGITHGIGAVMSVIGLVLLLLTAAGHDWWHVIGFTIYGSSLLILYLASTLYHSIQHPRLRHALRVFDHASIFLLIAGTYTPFLLISLRGRWGWTMLAVVWTLALVGILFKILYVNRYEALSTVAYVLMGWLCMVAYKQMVAHIPAVTLVWLIGGGVVYTAGVVFYAWQRLPYNHAIWHVFVLGGSACHYVAILSLASFL